MNRPNRSHYRTKILFPILEPFRDEWTPVAAYGSNGLLYIRLFREGGVEGKKCPKCGNHSVFTDVKFRLFKKNLVTTRCHMLLDDDDNCDWRPIDEVRDNLIDDILR